VGFVLGKEALWQVFSKYRYSWIYMIVVLKKKVAEVETAKVEQ
jgi:hypothetical protein